MKKFILILILAITIQFESSAQPPGGGGPGGGGGGPCPPFSPCWCAQHPGHPNCPPTAVPIDDYWYVLALAGILFAFYNFKKQKQIS